ncbi:MAG: ferredoxin [Candidatus Nealsonbacteria bacterium]|nr:ferredoxin [Candidatus Nealsonbacteria bacterium]
MAEKIYKVKVIRDLCIGAGSCEVISPKVFKVDEEAKAIILGQGTNPDENGFVMAAKDTAENVIAAAKSCPTFAIIVLDETGKQIWPEL